LAYLGNGRFCRTIGIEYAEQEGITVCSLPDGRPAACSFRWFIVLKALFAGLL
jgi:hypothetical protein